MSSPRASPYLIGVGLYDTPMRVFTFDQDRVVVGRADDADLRVRHAAMARRQLTVERIVPPIGPTRFRIIPHGGSNATLVNGVVAVEGALKYHDVMAVGEVRLVLRRAARPPQSQTRVQLLARVAMHASIYGLLVWILFFRRSGGGALAALEIPDKLFTHLPIVSCFDPETCAERAKQAYARGRTFAKQAAAVPGNWYRASIEFYRAREFQTAAGRNVIAADQLQNDLREAATTAETNYNDLLFQLARDLQAKDIAGLGKTITYLEAAVPDPDHPIRVKLADYLRDNPEVAVALPESGGGKKP